MLPWSCDVIHHVSIQCHAVEGRVFSPAVKCGFFFFFFFTCLVNSLQLFALLKFLISQQMDGKAAPKADYRSCRQTPLKHSLSLSQIKALKSSTDLRGKLHSHEQQRINHEELQQRTQDVLKSWSNSNDEDLRRKLQPRERIRDGKDERMTTHALFYYFKIKLICDTKEKNERQSVSDADRWFSWYFCGLSFTLDSFALNLLDFIRSALGLNYLSCYQTQRTWDSEKLRAC